MNDSVEVVTEVRFTVDDDAYGGRLVVADPCYVDKDDGGTADDVLATRASGYGDWGKVFDGCAGDWVGEVEIETETQGWGDRVSVLRLRRVASARARASLFPEELKYVGSNGVDSGQMYAAGVEHLPLDYDKLISRYYDSAGEWTNRQCFGAAGGVVSSTGYGDGVYPVYAKYVNEEVVCVEVRFLEEDDEEE